MSDLAEIILLIESHHRKYPSHGLDCACMDKYIQQVRKLTKCSCDLESKTVQNRTDYVIRKAIDR